jgi:hypothetical protein
VVGAVMSADVAYPGPRWTTAPRAAGAGALAAGEFYQSWLRNEAGTLVPLGPFSSSDERVSPWSGVLPKDFPTITMTIESTDNVQASCGRRVLVGTVEAT